MPTKCITCSSPTRGATRPYATMVEVMNRSPKDCSCFYNMIEATPKSGHCICKASNYYQFTDSYGLV